MKTFCLLVLAVGMSAAMCQGAEPEPKDTFFIDQWIDQMAIKGTLAEKDWGTAVSLSELMIAHALKLGAKKFVKTEWDAKKLPQRLTVTTKQIENDGLKGTVVVTSGSIKAKGEIARCLIFCTGNIEAYTIRDSIIFCNGTIDNVRTIWNSIIFCNGEHFSVGRDTALGDVFDSAIFCSGIFRLRFINDSLTHACDLFFFEANGASTSSIHINLAKNLRRSRGDKVIKVSYEPLAMFSFFSLASLGLDLADIGREVIVSKAREGSKWRTAGIKAGDVLATVDGVKIVSSEQAATLVRQKKSGTAIEMQIRRRGEVIQVTVSHP